MAAGIKTGTRTNSTAARRGYMAPKPNPVRFVLAVGTALTILAAVMTWAAAAPESSIYPIYQSQLLLLY